MAGFSDLPNEIVLMIWHRLEVDDIYNFSIASKCVYILFREKLREHCDLKRRLSTISNRETNGVFARILKEILVNPRAALYPSVLVVNLFHMKWEDEDQSMPKEVQHLSLRDLDLNLLRQASEATGLLQSWDIDLWIDNMLDGDEDPVIAILLILLPNLTRLSYSNFFSFPPGLRYALAIITDYSQPYRALSRLREVQCRCVDVEDNIDYGEFEVIRAFASLPHIRSITSDCIGTYQNDNLVHQSRPPRSNIKVLNLTNSAIDPKSLSEFLNTTHRLECFVYTPCDPNHNPECFDPFWIRTGLQSNAMYTLQSLTLLPNGHRRMFMGSLVELRALKVLETDLGLLLGDPTISVHKICMVLPLSIETVRLHVDNATDAPQYQPLMCDVKDSVASFPYLSNFTLVGTPHIDTIVPSPGLLILELKDLGVSFHFESLSDD